MYYEGVSGIRRIVMTMLSWLPSECQNLVLALFGLFSLFLVCKIVKLVWDVLPVA